MPTLQNPLQAGILTFFTREASSKDKVDCLEKTGNILLFPVRSLFGRSYKIIDGKLREEQMSAINKIAMAIFAICLLPLVLGMAIAGVFLTRYSTSHQTARKVKVEPQISQYASKGCLTTMPKMMPDKRNEALLTFPVEVSANPDVQRLLAKFRQLPYNKKSIKEAEKEIQELLNKITKNNLLSVFFIQLHDIRPMLFRKFVPKMREALFQVNAFEAFVSQNNPKTLSWLLEGSNHKDKDSGALKAFLIELRKQNKLFPTLFLEADTKAVDSFIFRDALRDSEIEAFIKALEARTRPDNLVIQEFFKELIVDVLKGIEKGKTWEDKAITNFLLTSCHCLQSCSPSTIESVFYAIIRRLDFKWEMTVEPHDLKPIVNDPLTREIEKCFLKICTALKADTRKMLIDSLERPTQARKFITDFGMNLPKLMQTAEEFERAKEFLHSKSPLASPISASVIDHILKKFIVMPFTVAPK